MQLDALFDTATHTVIHMMWAAPLPGCPGAFMAAQGFMVIRKSAPVEDADPGVYRMLEGGDAAAFEQKLEQWRKDAPYQRDVEAEIERWLQLGGLPLVSH